MVKNRISILSFHSGPVASPTPLLQAEVANCAGFAFVCVGDDFVSEKVIIRLPTAVYFSYFKT